MTQVGTFALGRFHLHCGAILDSAQLTYATYGTLNAERSNVVLYPTSYGATHADIEWLIGAEGILDPRRWFIIIPNMFGNGLSTSPSTLPTPIPGLRFSHIDNVIAQERLLREVFSIDRIAMAYGWSMGAQQCYHWALQFPQYVQRVVSLCATARTSEHNRLFLLSLKSALEADPAFDGTTFTAIPERGYAAFARIYASWAASQDFYRAGIHRTLGFSSVDEYVSKAWEPGYRKRDPRDLLAMIDTWLDNDVSNIAPFAGDLPRALGALRAPTLVIAGSHDLYFTPADCAADAALIPGARFERIESIWGHRAGNPKQNPADAAWIRSTVEAFLRTTS